MISDRFQRWAIHFRKERATPVLIVGVNTRKRQLVFTTCVGVARSEMRLMLVEAIKLIDQGLVEDDPEPGPEASRGLDT
jgi:hypothetical protein